MIPSVFVQLKSFPLTPNGKIDRNALPNVNEEQKEDVEELQSELEQALTDIWKQVLHLKVVGNEDNFFDLGGDSLSIVKVQILIETALAIKISTTELLQYPTIFQLLEHLKQQTKNKINPLNQQLSDKKKAAFQRFKTRAKR
jgi:acyl carrier protein